MRRWSGGNCLEGSCIGDPHPAKPPFRLIFEAECNDIVCADYPLTADEWVGECMRPLAGTNVDCLLYNLCSSDGYCCGRG